jgi:hypothetical protein
MPVIPPLGRLRWEDLEFEILGLIARLCFEKIGLGMWLK